MKKHSSFSKANASNLFEKKREQYHRNTRFESSKCKQHIAISEITDTHRELQGKVCGQLIRTMQKSAYRDYRCNINDECANQSLQVLNSLGALQSRIRNEKNRARLVPLRKATQHLSREQGEDVIPAAWFSTSVDIPHIPCMQTNSGLSAGTSIHGQKQQRLDLIVQCHYTNAKISECGAVRYTGYLQNTSARNSFTKVHGYIKWCLLKQINTSGPVPARCSKDALIS
ncbi:hypothetical protein Tco_0079104 [Tanacetum coccineum]